jgi:hypothetical protein
MKTVPSPRKTRILAVALAVTVLMLGGQDEATAATIDFRGRFETTYGPGAQQTIDWHFFRLERSTDISVRAFVEAGNARTAWMVLGSYSGGDFLANVTLAEPTCGEASCFSIQSELTAGIWAVGFAPKTTARDFAFWGDAVLPEFQFNWGGYHLSATGSADSGLEWVSHYEGNLDGSYAITNIPEPSSVAVLLGSLAAMWQQRSNCRRATRG